MRTDNINLAQLKALVKRKKLSEQTLALEAMTTPGLVDGLLEGTRATIPTLVLERVCDVCAQLASVHGAPLV
jgi:hypothetical protein